MFGRIRRRLTIGYVGILALILALFIAILAFSFSQRLTAQQDEKLKQAATAEIDKYVTGTGKFGSVKSNDESDIAVVALSPDGSTDTDVRVLATSSTPLRPTLRRAGKRSGPEKAAVRRDGRRTGRQGKGHEPAADQQLLRRDNSRCPGGRVSRGGYEHHPQPRPGPCSRRTRGAAPGRRRRTVHVPPGDATGQGRLRPAAHLHRRRLPRAEDPPYPYPGRRRGPSSAR